MAIFMQVGFIVHLCGFVRQNQFLPVISDCSCGHFSGSCLSNLKTTAPFPTWAMLSWSLTGAYKKHSNRYGG